VFAVCDVEQQRDFEAWRRKEKWGAAFEALGGGVECKENESEE